MSAYLDNSATTQPSDGVIDAMTRCMKEGFYNPSAMYSPAINAEKALSACRAEVAGALCVQPKEITFTSGGTESNNLAIIGSVTAMYGTRHVAVSAVEHPSVLESFERLKELGHRVTVLNVDKKGQLDFEQLANALDDDLSLVSVMQVNNETGAISDAKRISDLIKRKSPNTLYHVDGVQGFMRVPFDARICDLYTLSGHKIHGPKGIGALYVRSGVKLKPRQIGGGQENLVRSGTENTPGIAGLMEAVREMKTFTDRFDVLMAKKQRLWNAIKANVPEAILNGPDITDGAPHILNVGFPNVRGEVMLHALEGDKVYCSTGSACSSKKRHVSPVLLAMGITADTAEWALRFSLSPYTSDEEIDYAAEKMGKNYALLKRFVRR